MAIRGVHIPRVFGVPVYRPPSPQPDWEEIQRRIAEQQAADQQPDYGPVDYGPMYDTGPAPAAAPPYDPAQDPAFQQLLAQLGIQETAARTQATRLTALAQEDAAIARPRITEQGIEARRGIDTGYEGRGLFRSGARLRSLAIQRRGEGERAGDLERTLSRRVAGVQGNLDTQLRDLAMRRATAQLQGSLAAAGA